MWSKNNSFSCCSFTYLVAWNPSAWEWFFASKNVLFEALFFRKNFLFLIWFQVNGIQMWKNLSFLVSLRCHTVIQAAAFPNTKKMDEKKFNTSQILFRKRRTQLNEISLDRKRWTFEFNFLWWEAIYNSSISAREFALKFGPSLGHYNSKIGYGDNVGSHGDGLGHYIPNYLIPGTLFLKDYRCRKQTNISLAGHEPFDLNR